MERHEFQASNHDAELIKKCISQIPNKEYQLILNLVSAGYQNSEIAIEMGRDISWVKSAKYEARKKLLETLGNKGTI